MAVMTAPSDTQLVLSQIMGNQHTNLLGTVHGGNIMKFVDDAAGAVSARFAQGPAVTAAMDEMLFLAPVRVGDVLTVKTQVNWAGRSSMEVGARVGDDRLQAGDGVDADLVHQPRCSFRSASRSSTVA